MEVKKEFLSFTLLLHLSIGIDLTNNLMPLFCFTYTTFVCLAGSLTLIKFFYIAFTLTFFINIVTVTV